jgi:hypothetical protein
MGGNERLVGWRKKDRYRFRNPDLVAICHETQCREVFDLHEAICDLIDEERRNGVQVSLLTLATMIHDYPQGGEWEEPRIAALEQLRARGLVEFEGEVSLTGELLIKLPERVYLKWHEAGERRVANERPRCPKTGRLLPKNPAPAPRIPTGSPVDPDRGPEGSPVAPSETETETEKGGIGVVRGSATGAPEALRVVEDPFQAAAQELDRVGIRTGWWVDSIRKLQRQYPSLPDEVFFEALSAVERKVPEGSTWTAQRAWSFLSGCVRRSSQERQAEAERQSALTSIDMSATERSYAAFMAEVNGGDA